jgi:hypothetical protein
MLTEKLRNSQGEGKEYAYSVPKQPWNGISLIVLSITYIPIQP